MSGWSRRGERILRPDDEGGSVFGTHILGGAVKSERKEMGPGITGAHWIQCFSVLDGPDFGCLRTFTAFSGLVLNALIVGQGAIPFTFNVAVVNE